MDKEIKGNRCIPVKRGSIRQAEIFYKNTVIIGFFVVLIYTSFGGTLPV
jgi:hypothetical protein